MYCWHVYKLEEIEIMKRRVLFAVMVAVALLGGLFTSCSEAAKSTPEESVERLDKTYVFYSNWGQVGDKSALDEIITEGNRSLIATMIAANSGSFETMDYTKQLLRDLGTTGLDTSTPIYGYVEKGSESVEYTLVASVADAEKIDNFIEYFSTMIDEKIDVKKDGNTRKFAISVFNFAYNSDRFVMVAGANPERLLDAALNSPAADLTAFSKYDVAYSLNIDKVMEYLCADVEQKIDASNAYMERCTNSWEREWEAANIAKLENNLKTYETIKGMFEENSSLVYGLTYEAGRIVAEMSFDGLKSEYQFVQQVSNDYLANVDNKALAVLNLGIDGEKVSDLLSEFVTADYAETFGLGRNEFNIYFGILCDAVKSINGDATIALLDLKGTQYGVSGANALLAVDVTDDYIMSNVSNFGAGFLQNYGNDTYGLTYYNNNIKIGQEEDTLFVTLNAELKEQVSPITNKAWCAELSDSYGYLVVDVDNLMQNSFISSSYRTMVNNMNSNSATYLNNLVDSISYAYLNINTPTSLQMVIAFEDQQTNSLEQIIRQLAPLAISEITSDVF